MTILRVGRRQFLQGLAATATAAGISTPAFAIPKTIKIGLVIPQTGPLAIFAANTPFVLEQLKRALGGQIDINGTKHPYEIIIKDSQSSPNRAAEVALSLILKDRIDLMLASATPETTNPVADQCELNGVPCISTLAPLEAFFLGRKGDPKTGFASTFHFFLPAVAGIGSFIGVWKRIPTNRKIGFLFPNDGDGNTFSGMFPMIAKANGIGDYQTIDPGRFDSPVSNFGTQIAALKKAEAEICLIVSTPPDFNVFWNQAAQQGYRPKVLTPSRVANFPSGIAQFGERAVNFSIEVWWSRYHPFSSSLTGQSSAELANEFEKSTHVQSAMSLGFDHALFEVAFDVLKRTQDLGKRSSITEAVRNTDLKSIVGRVNFGKGPFPNCSASPVVGGQWRKGEKWPLDLLIVDNTQAPEIPVNGEPQAIAY